MKGQRPLALSLLVSLHMSATTRLADPTSEAEDREEKQFIASIERRLAQKTPAAAAVHTQTANATSATKPHNPVFAGTSSPVSPSASKARPASPSKTEKKNEAHATHEKASFSGFFCGLSGSMNHIYAKADLYSIGWKQLGEKRNTANDNAYWHIHTGSFAYNNNTWLFQGQAFIGYDFALHPWIRVGFELQGGLGWRSYEVASCGVAAWKNEALEDQTINLTSSAVPNAVKNGLSQLVIPGESEINYAYIRPTIQAPYSWSLLPRLGVPLSASTLLYAKVGVKFENMTVTDHPETIDIQTQYYPKQTADKIYDKTKATWVGGLGFEANISRKMFLRLEYYCSGGPHINLEHNDLKDNIDNESKSATSNNRQLDHLNVQNMRNFQLGLGAGLRF